MDILILLKANMRYKKGAFISVTLLMVIITMALTAVLSMSQNQQSDLQEALERANIGDLGVFIDERYLTEEMLEAIEENPNTASVDVVKGAAVKNNVTVNGTESSNPIIITPINQDEHNYAVFNEDLTGFEENPETVKSGEIYLPLGMKELYHCEIGDEVKIELYEAEVTFRIKGFVEEPYVGSYFIGVKQVFVSDDDLQMLYDLMNNEKNLEDEALAPYRLLHIHQKESSSLTNAEFMSQLADENGIIDNAILVMSKSDSMNYTTIFGGVFNGILYAFIILLLIVVLIVMGHSITTGIEAEYVNLGILKSQGFTKGKIRAVFILQYLLAEELGMLVGMFTAVPVTKILGKIFLVINGVQTSTSIVFGKSLLAMLSILFVCGLFILLKTRKIGKISPIRAIAGGRETIYFNSLIQVPISKKGLNFKMALRQLTANKRQYLSTMMIIAILVYFMIAMTLMSGLTSSEGVIEMLGRFSSDVEITCKDGFKREQIDDIEQSVSTITSIKKTQYKATDYWLLDNQQYLASIYVDPQTITGLLRGRLPLYDNEIVVTKILADETGKVMGDTVTLFHQGKSAEYIISGLFQSTSDVGRCFAMSLAAAERVGEIQLEDGKLLLEDSEKTDEVARMLNETYSDVLKAEPSGDFMEMPMIKYGLNSIAVIIYIISIVFITVVVQMVCARLFLKEKQDIGIMKAIGFTTDVLRRQFAIRFLVVAGIGSLVGLGLNLLFNNKMLSALLRMVGISNFPADYTLFTVVFPIAVICGCCFLFAYISSRNIKKVEVRELIVE